MLAEIREAPKDYLEAKNQVCWDEIPSWFHSVNLIQALVRDGFRCVVTRIYDIRFESVPYITVTNEEVLAVGGTVRTDCAHIVPDSTYFNVATNSPDKVRPFSSFLDLIPYSRIILRPC